MPMDVPSDVAVSYRQQYRRCGKTGCLVCASGSPGHGPYWYAFWREEGRARSRYLGKTPPSPVAAVDPAVAGPAAVARAPALRVRTLGGFALRRGDEPLDVDRWARTRSAALFKWLLAAPGHRLTRDQAIEALWPETPPDVAARNLRVLAHRLRAFLAGPSASPRSAGSGSALRFDAELLELRPAGSAGDGEWLDADDFAREATTALAGHDPEACRAALALYRGEYLPGDPYAEWAVARRDELAHLRARLLLHQAALCDASGASEEAMAALQAVLVDDRCHEDAALALMRLYVAAGRPAQALRLYRRLRAALRDELEMEPAADLRALAADLRVRHAPGAAGTDGTAETDTDASSDPQAPHNLPAPLTSFVGRRRELAALRPLLQTGGEVAGGEDRGVRCRLLTLTGPGGVGKTRLALALADELRDLPGPFPDGVWLVELAALADPARVPAAVAVAFDLREDAARPLAATLADALKPKRLLLILDNCEHLLSACATLTASLLAACPGLRILATSREALGVPGERRWPVPTLSLPEQATTLPPAAAVQYEAVRLFMERARAVRPDVALTPDTTGAVLDICRQVEGLPLALELAAGRVGVLGLREIAADLRASLRVLARGPRTTTRRQQSIRATLDWSYGLLCPPEQAVLRRLAVFAGGWTLAGAEAVCAADPVMADDMLDLLSDLAHKSLLLVVDGEGEGEGNGNEGPGAGATRYRLLEPMRHYAAERLAAAGETALAHDRHLRYTLELAETGEEALRGPGQGPWLARLEREHDNLRAALRWATESGQFSSGLRLAGALGRFWAMRGHLSEGRRWVEDLLVRSTEKAAEPDLDATAYRAKALRVAGLLASEQGDYTRAVERYDGARAALERLGDGRGLAIVLNNLGNVAGWQGDAARSLAFYEESLTLLRRLGERSLLSAVLGNLGSLAVEWGDAARAATWLGEALALQRELGDGDGVAKSLTNLAEVAQLQGDDRRAAALLEESLALKRSLGTKASIALSLGSLAGVVSRLGDDRRAAELHLEGLALRHELGDRRGIAEGLEGIAAVARRLGHPERAARLYGAAAGMREALRAPLTPVERDRHGREEATTREALGGATFDVVYAAGYAMTLEAALASARDIVPT